VGKSGTLVMILGLLATGCASGVGDPLVNRLIHKGTPAISMGAPLPDSGRRKPIYPAQSPAPTPSPAPSVPPAALVQSIDTEIRTALSLVASQPSPANRVRLARAYLRRGIDDLAIDQLQLAVAVSPHDAAAHELLARIWRDTGMLDMALASAHRAVYFAHGDPGTRNTLGTVLEALGRTDDAQRVYRETLAIDPQAAYATKNLGRLERQSAADGVPVR
jgi:Flp pilus assembly protein TadD